MSNFRSQYGVFRTAIVSIFMWDIPVCGEYKPVQ